MAAQADHDPVRVRAVLFLLQHVSGYGSVNRYNFFAFQLLTMQYIPSGHPAPWSAMSFYNEAAGRDRSSMIYVVVSGTGSRGGRTFYGGWWRVVCSG